jgi:cytochrome c oxidase subunit 1
MPTWALVAGQIISWLSGLPVLLVTAFGTLTNVYRSGMRWSPAAALVFLGVAGWSIGVIPAIADGTIAVNSVMHNTQWVPGHFHTYLLLGMVAMVLGFMTYLTDSQPRYGFAWLGYWLYLAGGVIFVLAFLLAGSASVPRRYAVHAAQWLFYDRMGSIGATIAVAGVLILVARFFAGIRTAAFTQDPS